MTETFHFRNSSNVLSADYDADTSELTVTFLSDDQYLYRGIDPSTYRSFTLASSPGAFVRSRLSSYDYERL